MIQNIKNFPEIYFSKIISPKHFQYFYTLFCLGLFYHFWKDRNYILSYASVRPNFNPIPPFELLGIQRPTDVTMTLVFYGLLGSLLLAAVLRHQIFALLAFCGSFYIIGSQLSFEKSATSDYVYHSKNIIIFVLFVMLLARKGENRIWPLTLIRISTAAVYFGAAYSRLLANGLQWMDGNTLQAIMYSHAVMTNYPQTYWLAEHYYLCQLLSIVVMTFEFTFVFVCLHPLLAVIYAAASFGFHEANYQFMSIDFFSYHSLAFIIFFVGGFGEEKFLNLKRLKNFPQLFGKAR